MKFDLSLQQYVEWEVKNVMPIKGKYGYRVILKYMDGSERPQQKSGFATVISPYRTMCSKQFWSRGRYMRGTGAVEKANFRMMIISVAPAMDVHAVKIFIGYIIKSCYKKTTCQI